MSPEKTPTGDDLAALIAQVEADDEVEEYDDVKHELAATRRKLRLIRLSLLPMLDRLDQVEERGRRRYRTVLLVVAIVAVVLAVIQVNRVQVCHALNDGIERDVRATQALLDASRRFSPPEATPEAAAQREMATKFYLEAQGYRYERGLVKADQFECGIIYQTPPSTPPVSTRPPTPPNPGSLP